MTTAKCAQFSAFVAVDRAHSLRHIFIAITLRQASPAVAEVGQRRGAVEVIARRRSSRACVVAALRTTLRRVPPSRSVARVGCPAMVCVIAFAV